jgi:serine kinase of HPr protein (carbohydrate metabolism regulator)
MKVKDIVEKLNLKVFSGEDALNKEVTGGYSSDLLSDVMGHADEGELWITLQTHKNIMGVASLKDLSGVILVKGFEPDQDTMLLSEKEGVAILGSDMEAFELCGRLYALLKGRE